MDNILKAEVFVNEDNNQLRVAQLILGYTPISRTFQVPKCVIKARDPRLHRISIVVEGFLLPKGTSIPEGVPLAGPYSSHPEVEEEDEFEVEKKEEELDSSGDEFKVFD